MKKTFHNLLLTGFFSIVCAMLLLAGPAEDKEKAKKRFEFAKTSFAGLHQVYPLTKGHQNEKAAKTCNFAHAKWVTFADIKWEDIEPSAPLGTKHKYSWDELDKAVALWQKYDFQIILQVNPKCSWAQGKGKFTSVNDAKLKTAIRNSALPVENTAAFSDLMQNLAERYDCDGLDDMKDGKYPIYIYEVLDEPQDPLRWNGTAEEYGKLLDLASAAIKKANKGDVLVLPNISFKGLAHATKSEDEFNKKLEEYTSGKANDDEKAFCRHYFEFIKEIVTGNRSYNAAGVQANGSIEEMVDDIAYLKKLMTAEGVNKQVWVTSSTSAPPLTAGVPGAYWSSVYTDGDKFSKILSSPKDKQFEKISKWHLMEQSKYGVKKIMTALGSNVQRFMLGSIEDRAGEDSKTYSHDGIIEAKWDSKTDNCEYGDPRPVLLSYKLLNRWVDGFTAVETLKLGTGVSAYKFTVKDRPVYVMWFEDTQVPGPDVRRAEKLVDITSDRQQLDIVYMFTDPSQKGPIISREAVRDGKITLRVSDLPILVLDEYVP